MASESIAQRGAARGRGRSRGRGRGTRGQGTTRRQQSKSTGQNIVRLQQGPGDGGEGGAGNAGLVAEHNWTPDCGRGSIFDSAGGRGIESHTLDAEVDLDEELAEVDEEQSRPIQERQSLSSTAEHLLSCLVAACQSVLSESKDFHIFSSASDILETLKSGNPWSTSAEFHTNTIESIYNRCLLAETSVSCAQFIFALNIMQFRIKMER